MQLENPHDEFEQACDRIIAAVVNSIRCREPTEALILNEPDCVYLKSADGRVLFGNPAYQQLFCNGVAPLGRFGNSYLHKTVAAVSQHSDQLILAGSSTVLFEHIGHDPNGRCLQFKTLKRSLLGAGNPQLAILGISRVISILSEGHDQGLLMTEQWNVFRQLSDRDRKIAILIARGIGPQEIADDLGVSRKTVETHRASILHELSLDSPVDLIKLLVRMQDSGFGDLGV